MTNQQQQHILNNGVNTENPITPTTTYKTNKHNNAIRNTTKACGKKHQHMQQQKNTLDK